MPSRSRPSRDEVRTSILKTARDIAAKEGWSCVTVRKVAERIGYTAPIIYEHFGSKDIMLTELLKDGYRLLYEAMTAAVEKAENSDERLRAMAVAYWDFAHESTELYQLMYGMEGASLANKDMHKYGEPLVALVGSELVKFTPDRVNSENMGVHVAELWSMFHGLIALDLAGYLVNYASGPQVLDTMIDDMLQILRNTSTPQTA